MEKRKIKNTEPQNVICFMKYSYYGTLNNRPNDWSQEEKDEGRRVKPIIHDIMMICVRGIRDIASGY
jgi:hypothetical protein